MSISWAEIFVYLPFRFQLENLDFFQQSTTGMHKNNFERVLRIPVNLNRGCKFNWWIRHCNLNLSIQHQLQHRTSNFSFHATCLATRGSNGFLNCLKTFCWEIFCSTSFASRRADAATKLSSNTASETWYLKHRSMSGVTTWFEDRSLNGSASRDGGRGGGMFRKRKRALETQNHLFKFVEPGVLPKAR